MFSCEFCGKEFLRPVTSGHKRKCPAFLAANPERRPPACVCGHESTSLTQMKRHRVSCQAWKSRDASKVRVDRYVSTLRRTYGDGVTNPVHVPEVAARKAATMKERYGAENPFSRDSILFEKVQSHWDGKDRTAHLPKDNFSRPEIKEKIRNYWIVNHGVTNGSQVPEIRAKQLATSLERYGDEHVLRIPAIRLKGVESLLKRFGVDDAAKSPEIREKIRGTNMSRYGVPWTTQNAEVLDKLRLSHFRRFGSWYGSTDEWRESYARQVGTIQDKIKETSTLRYGFPNYMSSPELAASALARSRRAGPNSCERRIQELFPQFMFVGDGSYWRYLPLLGQNKNPDFILPGPDPDAPFSGASVVLEHFGIYWHGEAMTGESTVDHESRIVAAWAGVGFRCLVVWEAELDDEPALRSRISSFLGLSA